MSFYQDSTKPFREPTWLHRWLAIVPAFVWHCLTRIVPTLWIVQYPEDSWRYIAALKAAGNYWCWSERREGRL